ncbi:MAG: hypothetical protein IJ459_03165 [Clostridia bacterium]|nr:hypothetical protein [Clostridia bacterium]
MIVKKVLKKPYTEAQLDVVLLDELDVITTSVQGELGDGNNRDDDGWTSPSW